MGLPSKEIRAPEHVQFQIQKLDCFMSGVDSEDKNKCNEQ